MNLPTTPSATLFGICLPQIELGPAKKKRVAAKAAERPRKKSDGKDDGAPTVLLFGRLRELALYRAELLERMGYRVIVPRDHHDAIDAIHDGGFQIAILSYTLANEDVQELAHLIRQTNPGCPLVTIAQHAHKDPAVQPDEIVLSELGPSGLIAALRRLARQRTQ